MTTTPPVDDLTAYIETELSALMDETDDLRERFSILTHLLLVKRVYRVQAMVAAMGVIEARLCDPVLIASLDHRQLLSLYRTFQSVWRSQCHYLMAHLDYLDDGREEELVEWFRRNEMIKDAPRQSPRKERLATVAVTAERGNAGRTRSSHRISENPTSPPRPVRRRVAEETQRVDVRELARAGVFRDPSCPSSLILSSGLEVWWQVREGIGETLYLHLTFFDARPLPDPTLELVFTERGFGKRAAVRCPGLVEEEADVQFCRRPCEVMYLVQHPQRGWEVCCRRCARVTYRSQRLHRTLQCRYESDPGELERAMAQVSEAAQAELLAGRWMPARVAQRHRALMATMV